MLYQKITWSLLCSTLLTASFITTQSGQTDAYITSKAGKEQLYNMIQLCTYPGTYPASQYQTLCDQKLFEKVLDLLMQQKCSIHDTKTRSGIIEILMKVLEKERSLKNDYYIFYHAQKRSMSLVEHVLKYVCNETGDFIPLRDPQDINCTKTAHDYWRTSFWDRDPEHIKNLLSVNISLCGNLSLWDHKECTLDYFFNSFSCRGAKDRSIIEEIFDKHNLKPQYIDSLYDIYNQYGQGPCGNLYQICIPKNSIDDFVFFARRAGDSFELHNYTTQELLDRYCNNTDELQTELEQNHCSINSIDLLQARIILNKKLFKKISNIKIFSYSALPKNQEKKYQEEVKKIIEQAR